MCNTHYSRSSDYIVYLYVSTFRLILIAEKETVYDKFPTPLINRLEKHFVRASSMLSDWQEDVLEKLMSWVKEFSSVRYLTLMLTLF